MVRARIGQKEIRSGRERRERRERARTVGIELQDM